MGCLERVEIYAAYHDETSPVPCYPGEHMRLFVSRVLPHLKQKTLFLLYHRLLYLGLIQEN